jgi:hypothetical protein
MGIVSANCRLFKLSLLNKNVSILLRAAGLWHRIVVTYVLETSAASIFGAELSRAGMWMSYIRRGKEWAKGNNRIEQSEPGMWERR